MKLFIKGLLLAGLFSGSAYGFSISDIKPTVGYDLMSHHLETAQGFGKNVIKSKYVPMSNVYLGFRFHKNLGIELGYHRTSLRKHQIFLNDGHQGLGVKAQSNEGHDVHYKAHGPYMAAVLFSGIPTIEDAHEAYLSFGVVNKRVFVRDSIFLDSGILQTPPLVRTFKHRKSVFRAGVGTLHRLSDYMGLRTSISWENTAKIKPMKPDENPGSTLAVKTKNTINYGLGVYLTF